ncbi:hypothetical protein Heshes_18770 [Alicyclobacillus hesperidum]|uniref:RNA polymerase sigma-70 region 2 domain-containing protein n=1 Tax=Alicyclobacillus hesperidum TaxID=89784 RepID=A0AA37U1T0_9BACL|nr:sigma-70 family RNA polymerase sigma factor [Alicyclobacillus hesperidum]GLV14193.1 hypothetical protein Heshes_18770 [Alicyclobacillus hesperidum]
MDWLEMDLTNTVRMAQRPCGDRERQDVFLAFAPLLRRVARTYQHVAGYEEAYQEACVALLRAIATYQPETGPFPAYAKARVHGDVRTAMRRLWTAAERQAFARPTTQDGDESEIGATLIHVYAAGQGEAASDQAVDKYLLQDAVERLAACAALSARERMWLEAARKGQPLDELAKVYGVSYDTAKTWQRRAIGKMRRAATKAGLTASDIL